MKKTLQFCYLLMLFFAAYQCTKIDYAILKNQSEDKITIKLNGRLFVDEKKTVLIKQIGNFFEYEIQPNTEEILAEFYNSEFNEDVFNFDTLIIVSKKSTLRLNSKTEIFNQFKATKKDDFDFVISE